MCVGGGEGGAWRVCTFPRANCCALIWLTGPELLFVGIMMGASLLVWQFPVLFVVKKLN